MKDSPDFECEWKAKRIPKPECTGVLEFKMISYPAFVDDDFVYAFDELGFIGLDLKFERWHHFQCMHLRRNYIKTQSYHRKNCRLSLRPLFRL